jgi:hypothetical protein
MKQTAVEHLQEYLSISLGPDRMRLLFNEFEKAKAMEKEQIIDFGYDIADDLACGKYRDKKHMEERYNEYLTFKSE